MGRLHHEIMVEAAANDDGAIRNMLNGLFV